MEIISTNFFAAKDGVSDLHKHNLPNPKKSQYLSLDCTRYIGTATYILSLMEESAGAVSAISKIMCAVDGSEHSFRAANYAVLMAKNFGAELRLVHVIHNTGFTNPDDYGLYDLESEEVKKSEIQEIRQETEEWLNRIKNSADQDNSVLTKVELVGTSTSVESAVVNYAKRNLVEIIILGAAGRTGIKKLLVGSVTSAVISHAHCPVMVVK